MSYTYKGDALFAQVGDNGTDYWVPGDPYINSVTGGAPPLNGLIALATSTRVQTLTFDPPVTGLVMAVVTMGDASTTVRYDFDHPITLLSQGPGFGGNGTLVVEGDHILAGTEGHGVVQFTGTISTLSWTVVGDEPGTCNAVTCPQIYDFHGFTIGIRRSEQPD